MTNTSRQRREWFFISTAAKGADNKGGSPIGGSINGMEKISKYFYYYDDEDETQNDQADQNAQEENDDSNSARVQEPIDRADS